MMTTTSPLAATLFHQPWMAQLVDKLIVRWRAARVAQRCRASLAWAWDARFVSQLDDHTLRDIGVPDWVIEEARLRREGDRWQAGVFRPD
jgi:hypothetical protein